MIYFYICPDRAGRAWKTGQAGHGRGRFLGENVSCKSTLAINMNYVSMDYKVKNRNIYLNVYAKTNTQTLNSMKCNWEV